MKIVKPKGKLFLALILLAAFMFAPGGCVQEPDELMINDGLYPYQMFYIYAAPLWTTSQGGPNHDETVNYGILSTEHRYLVDDHGVLAIGARKQQWMLMAEEKGLEFDESTLRSRRFAIKNITTGRFINVRGLTAQSLAKADQGQQILMTEFENDDSFFWGINPQSVTVDTEQAAFSNANIISRKPNTSGAGILCLLGNYAYQTMKPSENTSELYAVQFLYGTAFADGTYSEYDPEYTSYAPNPQGCAFFNFSYRR